MPLLRRQSTQTETVPHSIHVPPRSVRADTLALMRRIDELHLELPFAGSWILRDLLRLEGTRVGRHRMRRLMRIMGVEAIYRKENTSARHPVYPYLNGRQGLLPQSAAA